MTDTTAGYVPPESAPPIDLRAPMPRVKRVNRVAVAAVMAGLGILIAFALVAALRQPDKTAAPAQSTTAFARSSFVGSSARWTVPQASWAFLPFIVFPPSICTTAALRPIAAIVPLSL